MHLKDYFELWCVARRRSRSESDYRVFQRLQARLLLKYLTGKGVELRGRSLLDMGSGVAGYSVEFAQQGARVLSLDLVQPAINFHKLSRIRASAEAVPIADNSVDMVFCASLIEHVAYPAVVLTESYRVLRPGGFAYFSFPPFYSPMGGHEYAPFHYLGERVALKLIRHHRVLPEWVIKMHMATEQPQSFAKLYKGWGLYRMTIWKFRSLLRHTNFVLCDISTRYWPVSFVRWPIVGEVLTWHAQFLLKKP